MKIRIEIQDERLAGHTNFSFVRIHLQYSKFDVANKFLTGHHQQ